MVVVFLKDLLFQGRDDTLLHCFVQMMGEALKTGSSEAKPSVLSLLDPGHVFPIARRLVLSLLIRIFPGTKRTFVRVFRALGQYLEKTALPSHWVCVLQNLLKLSPL